MLPCPPVRSRWSEQLALEAWLIKQRISTTIFPVHSLSVTSKTSLRRGPDPPEVRGAAYAWSGQP